MPKSNKSGGFKPAKNYEPRTPARGGKGGPKAGSRSPGHRGYRPVEEEPRKQRWNADERAARTGDRPERSDRGADRYGDRPARPERGDRYSDRPVRPERGGDRYSDRPARPERGDRYSDRPVRPERGGDRYGDRPQRAYGAGSRPEREHRYTERPQRGERYGERTDRQKWNDARNEERRAAAAAERTERPARGGKPPRVDAEGRNRSTRPERDFDPTRERPGRRFDDRPARGGFDRDERPARGADRAERPARGFDRDDRPQRPRADRDERPGRRFDDRPVRDSDHSARPQRDRFERDERPARRYEERPQRDRFERDERPTRRFGERAERADRGGRRDAKPAFHGTDDVVLERLEAQAVVAGDVEGVTFAELGLGQNIVRALAELGAEHPFPIQAATIPVALGGTDVLGRGRTGSGKTIAFGAPLVERLLENGGGANRKPGRKPRALILAPTRELALQIDRTVQPIARSVGLFTTQIYGGVSQHRQVGALQRGVDIVIGTPGRIEDLIEQRRLDLSEVTVTVLDEADHMCDLGFLEPVQRILRRTKDGGQRLLFSATLDKGVAKLVEEFLVEPSVHEVAGEDQASGDIDHRVLIVEHREKAAVIEELADRHGKTLVFARTRAYAEQLADQLDEAGLPATSLHGDLNQAKRTRNLGQLTSGRVSILVATDVAARGIHVDDIDLVIQADAPDEYKTYLHRSGRTGRAGKKGTVVTLITRPRGRRMAELLDRAEIDAEMVTVAPGDPLLRELATGRTASAGAHA